MKKFLSILLAAMMLLAITSVAMADNYTITAPDNGHTYEVLQIFKGTFADGKLSEIKWGKNGTGTEDAFVAESVLKELRDVNDDAAYNDAAQLAVILKYVAEVTETKTVYGTVTNGSALTVPAGYYLIRDVYSADWADGDSATLYVVRVGDNINISPKTDTVKFEKQIMDKNDSTGETSGWQDSADYDIGDDVPFKMSFTFGNNYDQYDHYYLKLTDEMEKTLTFTAEHAEDVVVKVDGTQIDTGYTVARTDDQNFTVEFTDTKEIAAIKKGSVVTVEYSAELNSNANLGKAGNMNKANATFSNNPYSTGDGYKNETGDTPWDAVIVFTYQVVVNKVDSAKEPLTGAEFTLTKTIKGEGDAADTTEVIDVVKSDDGTTFSFVGLDDGIYTLEETVVPNGYNKCPDITFTVEAGHVSVDAAMTDFNYAGRQTILQTLSGNKTTGEIETISTDASTGTAAMTVVNKSGATLPETGGIGTTLFYLIGGLMAAGSALTLVIRRRADADEE